MYHTQNSQDFVAAIKDPKLDDSEILTSYDVTALFTSVPVDGVLEVVKDLLQKDNSWKSLTYLQLILMLCKLKTYLNFAWTQLISSLEDKFTNKIMDAPWNFQLV